MKRSLLSSFRWEICWEFSAYVLCTLISPRNTWGCKTALGYLEYSSVSLWLLKTPFCFKTWKSLGGDLPSFPKPCTSWSGCSCQALFSVVLEMEHWTTQSPCSQGLGFLKRGDRISTSVVISALMNIKVGEGSGVRMEASSGCWERPLWTVDFIRVLKEMR